MCVSACARVLVCEYEHACLLTCVGERGVGVQAFVCVCSPVTVYV